MEADHKHASSSAPPTGGGTNPFEDSGAEAPSEPCEPSFPFEDSGPEKPSEPGEPSFPFEDSGPEKSSEPGEPSFPFEDSGPERSRARCFLRGKRRRRGCCRRSPAGVGREGGAVSASPVLG